MAHLLGLVAPLLGTAAAVALLWADAVSGADLALLGAMYLVTGFGITVGFHRLLTHHAFAAPRAVQCAFAVLGSMALQGSVIDWVADHRKHHAFADRDGDPHSPHGHGSAWRDLWHGHVGWLFRTQGRADRARYAPELLEDPVMRAIDRGFPALVGLSLALPFVVGAGLSGSLAGGLRGLLWGGFVRVFLLHHVIFSVNSIGHYTGARRFRTDDQSRNVAWLAPLSLGESWHHNHHAFPRAAVVGMRWFELDLSGLLIRALRSLGLARDVVTISPERRRARLLRRPG
jgi:stearoyl-CoA desaturase (delta-9 desaturase)